ncbi:hypothetical protein COLO4_04627 [Corchorus olitorius]|uniref:RRM domain-containing protein n=1 Tax=Corchorus olitorius TaxID=93759 RepID=A0A1R3KT79_9ROSI|nr:hypothetical protein COLO4_04627 [Corchorus olitorius]
MREVRRSSSGFRRKEGARREKDRPGLDYQSRSGRRGHVDFDWKGCLKSIFVDNIGSGVSKKQVWDFFNGFGRVVDVYFPPAQRRRNDATRYGFVRYRFEEERCRTIQDGHYTLQWGIKILVKMASRSKFPLNKPLVAAKDLYRGFQGSQALELSRFRDNRSYKEVVISKNPPSQSGFEPVIQDPLGEEEEPTEKVKGFQSRVREPDEGGVKVKALQRFPPLVLDVCIPEEDMEWIGRSALGRLAGHGNLSLINDGLIRDGIQVELKPYDQDKAILVFPEVELRDAYLQDYFEFFQLWFSELIPLEVYCKKRDNVILWVKLQDVPIQLWHINFFRALGYCWGKFVKLEEGTSLRNSFLAAWVQVEVSHRAKIPAFVSGTWNVVDFNISIQIVPENSLPKSPGCSSLVASLVSESSGSESLLGSEEGESEELCSFVKDTLSSGDRGICMDSRKIMGSKADMQLDDINDCFGESNPYAANQICSSGTVKEADVVPIEGPPKEKDDSLIISKGFLSGGVVRAASCGPVLVVGCGPVSVGYSKPPNCEKVVVDSEGTISAPLGLGLGRKLVKGFKKKGSGSVNMRRKFTGKATTSSSSKTESVSISGESNNEVQEIWGVGVSLGLQFGDQTEKALCALAEQEAGEGLEENIWDKLKRIKPSLKSWAYSKFGKGSEAIAHRESEIQRIEGLIINGDGHGRTENPIEIKADVADFFEQHFCQKKAISPIDLDCPFKKLSEENSFWLERDFSEAEVFEAIMSCDGSRAPGPDGYNLLFFQKNWAVLKKDIMTVFQEFHRTGLFDRKFNPSFLTLIPKVIVDKYCSDDRCLLPDLVRIKVVLWLILGVGRMILRCGELSCVGIVLTGRKISLRL